MIYKPMFYNTFQHYAQSKMGSESSKFSILI